MDPGAAQFDVFAGIFADEGSPADAVARLENQGLHSAQGTVAYRGQSGHTAADDDNVEVIARLGRAVLGLLDAFLAGGNRVGPNVLVAMSTPAFLRNFRRRVLVRQVIVMTLSPL